MFNLNTCFDVCMYAFQGKIKDNSWSLFRDFFLLYLLLLFPLASTQYQKLVRLKNPTFVGDLVNHLVTLNEPMELLEQSYTTTTAATGIKDEMIRGKKEENYVPHTTYTLDENQA